MNDDIVKYDKVTVKKNEGSSKGRNNNTLGRHKDRHTDRRTHGDTDRRRHELTDGKIEGM